MGGRQERLQQSQVGSSSKASIICHFYCLFLGTNTTQVTLFLLHDALHSHLVDTVLVLHLLLLIQLLPHILQNHIQVLRIYSECNAPFLPGFAFLTFERFSLMNRPIPLFGSGFPSVTTSRPFFLYSSFASSSSSFHMVDTFFAISLTDISMNHILPSSQLGFFFLISGTCSLKNTL